MYGLTGASGPQERDRQTERGRDTETQKLRDYIYMAPLCAGSDTHHFCHHRSPAFLPHAFVDMSFKPSPHHCLFWCSECPRFGQWEALGAGSLVISEHVLDFRHSEVSWSPRPFPTSLNLPFCGEPRPLTVATLRFRLSLPQAHSMGGSEAHVFCAVVFVHVHRAHAHLHLHPVHFNVVR